MAEKQQIIIDELRRRFDVQFGDLGNMSHEEVRENAERAVHEIVDPMKSKVSVCVRACACMYVLCLHACVRMYGWVSIVPWKPNGLQPTHL